MFGWPWFPKQSTIRVAVVVQLPFKVSPVANAALDAALTALAQSVADAAARIATATQPVDLSAEIDKVNTIKAEVDSLALPPAP